MDSQHPFAINTYSHCRTMTLEATLERLARLGGTGVEAMLYPGHLWPEETDTGRRRALARRAREAGVPFVSLNMPNIDINIAAAAPAMRAYSLSLLLDMVALAGELGAPGLVIGPGKANPLAPAPADQLRGHLAAALDRLVPAAERAGIRLFMENMPFAFLPDAGALAALVAGYDGRVLGVCYDITNAHFIGEDPAAAFTRLADRTALVHVSDTGRGRYEHAPVGTGSVPFAGAADAMAAAGWRGPVVLEIVSDDPDTDHAESARRLLAMGWGTVAGPSH